MTGWKILKKTGDFRPQPKKKKVYTLNVTPENGGPAPWKFGDEPNLEFPYGFRLHMRLKRGRVTCQPGETGGTLFDTISTDFRSGTAKMADFGLSGIAKNKALVFFFCRLGRGPGVFLRIVLCYVL